jgi:hypothetical protein
LKAFGRVEIDSHYRATSSELSHRAFSFTASDDGLKTVPAPSDRRTPETTVRLVNFLHPYVDECPKQLPAIAQRLIGHFLPLFLDPAGPSIALADSMEAIDLRAFFKENFEALSTERKFQVLGQNFTLNGFRLHGALADHHGLVYAADFREVLSERLSRLLPNLKSRLNESDQTSFYYLAFVQGEFLNEKANNERTDFSIPKDAPKSKIGTPPADAESEIPSLFEGDISLKMIREGALDAISQDLKPFLDELNVQKEEAAGEITQNRA